MRSVARKMEINSNSEIVDRSFEEPFSLLPIEIRSSIYDLCWKKDLKNLTLCNKWLRDDVVPVLWNTIDVRWGRLKEFTPAILKKGNSYMRFVSKLNFNGYLWEEDYMRYRFAFLLRSCNPERLTSIVFRSSIPTGTIRLIGGILVHLEHLVFVSVRADWENLPLLSTTLKSLIVRPYHSHFKKEHWAAIWKMEQLQSLELNYSWKHSSSDDLANVQEFKLKNLVRLELSFNRATDILLSTIAAKCVRLEDLTLGNLTDITGVTDLGISSLAHHRQTLKHLTLKQCPGITDESMKCLSKMPALESLRLYLCENLKSSCLRFISEIKSLKHFVADDKINPTDSEFICMGNLKSLQTLDIACMDKLTDVSLAVIGTLKLLKKLDISGCTGFTDEGLIHLAALPNLEQLSCVGCEDDGGDERDFKMKITYAGLTLHNLAKLLVEEIR